jgi:hypothetical protein
MAIRSTSAAARLARIGKRSVVVALFALLVASAALPANVLAAGVTHGVSHVVHTTDGQGDSPLVP